MGTVGTTGVLDALDGGGPEAPGRTGLPGLGRLIVPPGTAVGGGGDGKGGEGGPLAVAPPGGALTVLRPIEMPLVGGSFSVGETLVCECDDDEV